MNFTPLKKLQNTDKLDLKGYYRNTFEAGWQMNSHHAHRYYEIMYALSGSFCIEIANKDENQIINQLEVHKNQLVIIDAGCYHKLLVPKDKECVILNLEFGKSNTAESASASEQNVQDFISIKWPLLLNSNSGWQKFFSRGANYSVVNDIVGLESLMLKMQNHLHQSKSNDILSIISTRFMLAEILLKIGDCIEDLHLSHGGIVHVRKAINFIKSNYTQDITVVDVAKKIGVNSAYLHRLFKGSKYKSILSTINTLRVEKCAHLLLNTDQTLDEIAVSCGWSSRQPLFYEFKRHMGMTPSEYRKLSVDKNISSRQAIHEDFSLNLS